MRVFVVFALVVSVLSIIYKWRYRLINTLLAISFLRRLTVAVSMNLPAIKNKLLPGLFQRQTNS
ncbi:hypothetical protein [Lentibacillus sp. Marseille-P4043]|uniref:hypothetical protein n=1 Tax=Lentibacillus sp. Marseille-P4043 TaxID=2040293 RepID=UPI000D0BE316|nr:hypothetical protein [Lentibacillus sp. Marseille-P4043]